MCKGFPDEEVARIVLQINEAANIWRSAASASSRNIDLTPLPVRPSTVELAVFAALAQTYGRAVMDDPSFWPVLDFAAECGGVELVQRALWGEQFEDLWLATQLRDAKAAFEVLCRGRPDVFFAQARAALSPMGVRPLKSDKHMQPPNNSEGNR